jgi:hypothetical protein
MRITGENPDRLRSEAALAGPPLRRRTHYRQLRPDPPASPNRCGDRATNYALHTIAMCRLRYDPRTRAYARRRAS